MPNPPIGNTWIGMHWHPDFRFILNTNILRIKAVVDMFREQERRYIGDTYSETWDHVEEFWKQQFRHFLRPLALEILSLVWALRERGYDRELGAYSVMDDDGNDAGLMFCMFFRSFEYGMREDQPVLAFRLIDENRIGVRLTALNVHYEFFVEAVEFNPDIEHLFSLLLLHPID